MFESLVPMLTQINPKLLGALGVVALILMVVSLVKKAFKACICLLLVAGVFIGGIFVVNNVKEGYGISYDRHNEVLSLEMDSRVYTFPIKELKEASNYTLTFEENGTSTKVHMFIQRGDGTALSATGSNAVSIPNFMISTVTTYLKNNGIKYTIEESGTLRK